jgi:hypothetical protein
MMLVVGVMMMTTTTTTTTTMTMASRHDQELESNICMVIQSKEDINLFLHNSNQVWSDTEHTWAFSN